MPTSITPSPLRHASLQRAASRFDAAACSGTAADSEAARQLWSLVAWGTVDRASHRARA
jgi:hypothetical protein